MIAFFSSEGDKSCFHAKCIKQTVGVANSGTLSAISLMDSRKSKMCELLITPMRIKQLGKQCKARPAMWDHTGERSRKSNDAETENCQSLKKKE